MKKTISLLLIPFILVGCGEKNEEYYLKNIDSAEKKVKQCENDLEKAFKNDNEKEFLRLADDPECNAANKAINKKREIERQAKRKLEEENKRKAIEEARESIISKIKDMNWQDSIMEYLKTSCEDSWPFVSSPNCVAWHAIYEEKIAEGNQELEKLNFEELNNSEEKYCSKDKRTESPCGVWEKARNKKAGDILNSLSITEIEKQESLFCDKDGYSELCRLWKNSWNEKSKELTKFFVDNYDEFKKTYNICYEGIKNIKSTNDKTSEKNKYIRKIENSTPCQQVARAFREKKLGYTAFKTAID